MMLCLKITKKDLPKDIQKYINKKVITCVALFAVLEAIAMAVTYISWGYFSEKTNAGFHMSAAAVLCIAPFFISGFPWRLIDRSWSGTVIGISVDEETGVFGVGGGRGHLYTKNVIYLIVKKANGKEKYIAVKEFGVRRHIGFPVPNEGDVRNHLNEYSVGDTVYHFYGLKEYYVVRQNSDTVDCVICGAKNKKDRKNCFNCGHYLFKA